MMERKDVFISDVCREGCLTIASISHKNIIVTVFISSINLQKKIRIISFYINFLLQNMSVV
jgi:hypothetical protein